MPPLRKILDAQDADAQLSGARAAGLTNRDWAARHGICARSLHMWMLIRRRQRRQPPALRFVELLPPDTPAEPVRIHLDDLRIEIPADLAANLLPIVLRAVRTPNRWAWLRGPSAKPGGAGPGRPITERGSGRATQTLVRAMSAKQRPALSQFIEAVVIPVD